MRSSAYAGLALCACFVAAAGSNSRAVASTVTPVSTTLSDASSLDLKAAGKRRLLDHDHEDGDDHDHDADAPEEAAGAAGAASAQLTADGDPSAAGTVSEGGGTLAPSQYYGTYVVEDDDYGTMVEVVVTEDTREIMTNALPPWSTPFPVPANPNAVEEQNITWSLPLTPVTPFRNSSQTVREFGISVLGIAYEPGNAQRADCEDGSQLTIEAFNNSLVDFGVDENGAHVRDTDGSYHYHGLPNGEIAVSDESQDIVHIGFTFDSHLLYYSRSGRYSPSYAIGTEPRSGGVCTYSEPDIPEFTLSSTPDGTILEDWIYTAGSGDLDECNGITIDGVYAYFVTDSFPFIPRCHMGESTAGDGTLTGGGDGMGGGAEGPGGMPGAEGPGGMPGAEGPGLGAVSDAAGADAPAADRDIAGALGIDADTNDATAADTDDAAAAAADTDDAAVTDGEVVSGTQTQTMYQAVCAIAGAALLSVLM